MEGNLLKDIVEWDILNWSKAIDYWENKADLKTEKLNCLELGGRRGGLSLWIALKGHQVICSDLESPESEASQLHNKYKLSGNINYQSINAAKIPYENEFDIVIFKSILGSVCRGGNDKLKKEVIDGIHSSLKPNGKLLFAENLTSSFIHKFFRKKFTNWGSQWNYLSYTEIDHVFSSFSKISYTTVGFFAAFGRTEKQRNFLAKVDGIIGVLIPESSKYILIGIAEK